MESNDWDSFIDSLADEEIETKRETKVTKTYPCGQCGGTGMWAGGVNRRGNSKCIACQGRGFFTQSPQQREKARRSRQKSKANKAEAAMESNKATGLVDKLQAISEWNSFAGSMLEQHSQGKEWSTKQVEAAQRMLDKIEATRKAKEAEKAKNAVALSQAPAFERIAQLFEGAVNSGYKKPCYRAEGLKLSLAGAYSRNAGSIYVVEVETDEYLGKITRGVFHPTRGGGKAVPGLEAIAKDPKDAAVRYGQRTGVCSCCGAKLTNKESIEAGIGPICAGKWGL